MRSGPAGEGRSERTGEWCGGARAMRSRSTIKRRPDAVASSKRAAATPPSVGSCIALAPPRAASSASPTTEIPGRWLKRAASRRARPPSDRAGLAGESPRDDRGAFDAGRLGHDDEVSGPGAGRGHQTVSADQPLHVAGHDRLLHRRGDLGVAAGDGDAEPASGPIDVPEDPRHHRGGGAGRHDDRGLEPRRPSAHDRHVVGVDVHRVPADLLGGERDRIALQDQVLRPEVDDRGIQPEGRAHDHAPVASARESGAAVAAGRAAAYRGAGPWGRGGMPLARSDRSWSSGSSAGRVGR